MGSEKNGSPVDSLLAYFFALDKLISSGVEQDVALQSHNVVLDGHFNLRKKFVRMKKIF